MLVSLSMGMLLMPVVGVAAIGKCPSAFWTFGDSLSDTGNAQASFPSASRLHPPYGSSYTFCDKPGLSRYSDGRLIVDFVGVPLSPLPQFLKAFMSLTCMLSEPFGCDHVASWWNARQLKRSASHSWAHTRTPSTEPIIDAAPTSHTLVPLQTRRRSSRPSLCLCKWMSSSTSKPRRSSTQGSQGWTCVKLNLW